MKGVDLIQQYWKYNQRRIEATVSQRLSDTLKLCKRSKTCQHHLESINVDLDEHLKVNTGFIP